MVIFRMNCELFVISGVIEWPIGNWWSKRDGDEMKTKGKKSIN